MIGLMSYKELTCQGLKHLGIVIGMMSIFNNAGKYYGPPMTYLNGLSNVLKISAEVATIIIIVVFCWPMPIRIESQNSAT